MTDPSPSTIGRYEILGVIGKGGMGTLYLARDPMLDRQIAIKILRDVDDQMRQRFAREGRSAARLRHRNIVTVYDVGEAAGHPFIAMEYIHGETLADVIGSRRALPTPVKLELIEELCDGLGFAHKLGVIHRDVKPANLMIDNEGELKILDFGIARVQDSGVTEAGALIGTLNYMSPEQVSGRSIDIRSDIFAVGAVFYELLTNTQAFPGGILDGVIYRILQDQPAPLGKLCPDLGSQTIRIVERSLEKDPRRRYQDLESMRNDIRLARTRMEPTSEPIAGQSAETGTETQIVDSDAETRILNPEVPKSKRNWPRSAAYLMLAAVVVAGYLVLRSSRESQPQSAGPSPSPGIVEAPSGPRPTPVPDLPRTAPQTPAAARSGPPPQSGRGAIPSVDVGSESTSPPEAAGNEAVQRANDAFTQGHRSEALDQILQLPQDDRTRGILDDWLKSAVSDFVAARQRADAAGQLAKDSSSYAQAVAAQEEAQRFVRTDVVSALRSAWHATDMFNQAADAATRAAAKSEAVEAAPPAPSGIGSAGRDDATKPTIGGIPTIGDEQKAVRTVMDEYAAAYGQLSYDALKRVYPSAPSKLQKTFTQVKAIQVKFENEHIAINGDVAEFVCDETNTTRLASGSPQPQKASVTFTLRRSGNTWVIESLR